MYSSSYNFPSDIDFYIQYGFPPILYFHWLLINVSYNWTRDKIGENWAIFYVLCWIIIVGYFMIIQSINYFMTASSFGLQDVLKSIYAILLIPSMLIILITWGLLHFRLLLFPLPLIQLAIMRIKEELQIGF